MHPFSLNDKELNLVAGGDKITFPGGAIVTSMMYGEEGGVPPVVPLPELSGKIIGAEGGGMATTLAIGEEGGGTV